MIDSVAGLVASPRPAAMVTMEMITMPKYAESAFVVAAMMNPAAITSRPIVTIALDPKRCMSAIATGDMMPVAIAKGRVLIPA